jgi:DNA-directed RNA polymerase II subunit RPB11
MTTNYKKYVFQKSSNYDHTIGNLIQSNLLKNPDVVFSGYKLTHPLNRHLELNVVTNKEECDLTVKNTVKNLLAELKTIS